MITFQSLTVRRKRQIILDDISGHFPAGQLTGIIGPNGAGKSTLARALLGLMRYEGRVALQGQDIAGLSPTQLALRIAYLPQGQILHWPLSVERLVSLGRLPHLAPLSTLNPADSLAIEQAMERTGVLAMRGRDATQLSGGERARVLLARALASEAPALIVDEPLASLDPGYQLDVMDLLRRESQRGAMVACVLHDLDMALRYCDRLILLHQGRILSAGAPMEVLTPDHLRISFGIAAQVQTHDGDKMLVISGRRSMMNSAALRPVAPLPGADD